MTLTRKLNKQGFLTVPLVIAAYIFFIYKAHKFSQWQILTDAFKLQQAYWFLLVFLLHPFNILIESWHWKYAMSRFLNIKLSLAIKSVLGGLIPGLITPARMGEWLGRGYFLEKDQRKQATTVAAYAGFIKTMALVLWGSIALLWLNVSPFVSSSELLDKILNPLIMALVIFIILFVLSKRIAQKLFSLPMIRKRVHKDLQNFHWLDTRYRLISISIASLRLIIFYTQFYFMLLGFGIAPESLALLSLIPIYFMILTFLPVFSIGEPGLRGSVAILLFAPFIENSVLVGIAGMLLWMINSISPMILGSYFWIKKS